MGGGGGNHSIWNQGIAAQKNMDPGIETQKIWEPSGGLGKKNY